MERYSEWLCCIQVDGLPFIMIFNKSGTVEQVKFYCDQIITWRDNTTINIFYKKGITRFEVRVMVMSRIFFSLLWKFFIKIGTR